MSMQAAGTLRSHVRGGCTYGDYYIVPRTVRTYRTPMYGVRTRTPYVHTVHLPENPYLKTS
jgi:hypothetical protein